MARNFEANDQNNLYIKINISNANKVNALHGV